MYRSEVANEAFLERERVAGEQTLLTPAEVKADSPITEEGAVTVVESREAVKAALDPLSDGNKLVVVVGPCSVSDTKQALEYTDWLSEKRSEYGDNLELIQRAYLEKPRSGVGWEGFITDPHLDESYDVNHGLITARRLLRDITHRGVPVATEWLSLDTPEYYGGLVSWAAIGARTVESPPHRWKVSGMPSPVGFKNGVSGNVKVAIDAVVASRQPHRIATTTNEGGRTIITTSGNTDTHIVLRGGTDGPNYGSDHINAAVESLSMAGLQPRLMVDVSHGNSKRDHRNQMAVVQDLAGQISSGSAAIMGVMIESNLRAGKQPFVAGSQHEYGVSITDGCVDLEETGNMLAILSSAVQNRRRA